MTTANRCHLYLFESLCQCCLSSTVNATTSCDLTFGCRWEQSHKKWKRLMKKWSCVYLSDLWPAPKADIIPQCALIGWQQHLERHSRFSPGLVAKSHESIQRRLEGRETITHEEVLFTSHRCMMTEAVIRTQDTVSHFYLFFHSLIKKKRKKKDLQRLHWYTQKYMETERKSGSMRGSNGDSSYLVKHILMFGNHRPLEQRFYNTQVQDLVSDRHTNATYGLKEWRLSELEYIQVAQVSYLFLNLNTGSQSPSND